MQFAQGLLIRTLTRPDGRLTTVVVRRRRRLKPDRQPASAERIVVLPHAEGKPDRNPPVPNGPARIAAEFSRPVTRALELLGLRVQHLDRGDVALDGRRAPLMRVIREANLALAAFGRPPIRYPGVAPRERRR